MTSLRATPLLAPYDAVPHVVESNGFGNPRPEAVCSPPGVFSIDFDAFREALVRIDRVSTSPSDHPEPHAVELGRQLALGHWTTIERFERDGRRYYLGFELEPPNAGVPALTRRERQVLRLAELGQPNKRIAFSLGISLSAAATFLTRARRKLNGSGGTGEATVACELSYSCATRAGLPATASTRSPPFVGESRLFSVTDPDARITRIGERLLLVSVPIALRFAREAECVLTGAEKAVIELTLAGHSNAAIARKRRVSPRTVANQLAAAYKKLGVGSRRDLFATISGGAKRFVAEESALPTRSRP